MRSFFISIHEKVFSIPTKWPLPNKTETTIKMNAREDMENKNKEMIVYCEWE
jgi:hypothetical protein